MIDKETKLVVNVIVWDGKTQYAPPENTFLKCDSFCEKGDTWDEESQKFIRPVQDLNIEEDMNTEIKE